MVGREIEWVCLAGSDYGEPRDPGRGLRRLWNSHWEMLEVCKQRWTFCILLRVPPSEKPYLIPLMFSSWCQSYSIPELPLNSRGLPRPRALWRQSSELLYFVSFSLARRRFSVHGLSNEQMDPDSAPLPLWLLSAIGRWILRTGRPLDIWDHRFWMQKGAQMESQSGLKEVHVRRTELEGRWTEEPPGNQERWMRITKAIKMCLKCDHLPLS